MIDTLLKNSYGSPLRRLHKCGAFPGRDSHGAVVDVSQHTVERENE
jgi:hypothetical protein